MGVVPREGTGNRPGQEEVRTPPSGCLALDTGDTWRHLQEGAQEKEQVWRKTGGQPGSAESEGHGGDGVWAGSGRPPRNTYLQLVGSAGTVLLYLHEHPLLQLLQEGEQGLELGLQVLLYFG